MDWAFSSLLFQFNILHICVTVEEFGTESSDIDIYIYTERGGGGDRERERERQRQRQTDRQTDRQTERDRDRDRDRQTDRQTERQAGRQAGRQAETETDKQIDRDGWTDKHADRLPARDHCKQFIVLYPSFLRFCFVSHQPFLWLTQRQTDIGPDGKTHRRRAFQAIYILWPSLASLSFRFRSNFSWLKKIKEKNKY